MSSSPPPDMLAAVDLGSNSFHMVVAQVGPAGSMQVRDRLREPVRLGARLDASGRLPRPAWREAIGCLERFGERLRGLPAGAVRAVGTNALRRARNAAGFLDAATRALGHPVEVISGIEEARLIYLGVADATPDDGRARLVVDIGGGSTELIVGSGFDAHDKESLYMGCISQTLAHFADGTVTAARLNKAVLAAALELEPVAARFGRASWQRAIGASGTVRAVRDALPGVQDGEPITRARLERLRRAVLAAGHADALTGLGVRADRTPVFAGGLSIVLALFQHLDIEALEVSDGALREGLLLDLLGRIRHTDVRAQTVAALARRYHVDTQHAARVAGLARRLCAQVAPHWGLDPVQAGQLVEWAAHLHEIGLDVAHAEYHKHGAYILEHGDLPGFSRDEQRALAGLVRTHRRKFAAEAFADLPESRRETCRRLAVLLRLAVVLHRGRTPAAPPVPVLDVRSRTLRLRIPARWLHDHPLTRADLTQEAAYLADAGYTLTVARQGAV